MTGPAHLITTETLGHICVICINRPGKRNAFNLQMLTELAQAYTRFEQDDALRCALLVAAGDHFTAGLDLAEVGPAVASGDALFPAGAVDPLDLFEPRRTKPVICAVQGYCFTIGVELLLAADIRLAASGSTLSQMEVCRGIMPFGGATLRFPQVAGWGNAMRWMLTGGRFDAAEALRMGLVQEVVAPEVLRTRGVALAQEVADQAPRAVRQTRLAARAAMEVGRDAALAQLLDQARQLMVSADAQEGVLSFLERRKANFTGK